MSIKRFLLLPLFVVGVFGFTSSGVAAVASVDYVHATISELKSVTVPVQMVGGSTNYTIPVSLQYFMRQIDKANEILNGSATTNYAGALTPTQSTNLVEIGRVRADIENLIVGPTSTPTWQPKYDICETNTQTQSVTRVSENFSRATSTAWGWGGPVILDDYDIRGITTSADPENGNANLWDKGVGFGAANKYWRELNSDTNTGRMNNCALRINSGETRSFNIDVEVPATKYYYIGVGGDDFFSLYLNGNLILNRSIASGMSGGPTGGSNRNFVTTRLYRVHLEAGVHVFGFTGVGGNDPNGIWFELYNATKQQIIDSGDNNTEIAATNTAIAPYRIFSTRYDIIDTWGGASSGPYIATRCPSGWIAQSVGGNLLCVSQTRINTGYQLAPIMLYKTTNDEPLDINGVKTSTSGLPQACSLNTSMISGAVGGTITYDDVVYAIKSTYTNTSANVDGIPVKVQNTTACP